MLQSSHAWTTLQADSECQGVGLCQCTSVGRTLCQRAALTLASPSTFIFARLLLLIEATSGMSSCMMAASCSTCRPPSQR